MKHGLRFSMIAFVLLVGCGGRLDLGAEGTPSKGGDGAIDAGDPAPDTARESSLDTASALDTGTGDDVIDSALDAPKVDDASVACSFKDVQPILTRNCAVSGCHVLPTPPGSLILSPGYAYSSLVWVKSSSGGEYLVEPYHSERSYLYALIMGKSATGTMPMPPPGATSSPTAAEKDLIRCWIDDGALP